MKGVSCERLEASADENMEVPSCIESLAGSADQLRQLAGQAQLYYGKLLTCYGLVCEPLANHPAATEDRSTQRRISPISNEPPQSNDKGELRSKSILTLCRNNIRPSLIIASDSNKSSLELDRLESDGPLVASMQSILEILPLLAELSAFLERCFDTIDSSLKRATFYLNKSNDIPHSTTDQFQLTKDVQIDSIFVSLMDLMFALVSLDKIIETQTNLRTNLNAFLTVCKLIHRAGANVTPGEPDNNQRRQMPAPERLIQLIEYINSIRINLCIGDEDVNQLNSFFHQSIKHAEHLNLILNKDKSKHGFKRLEELFEEYITFYSDHLIELTAQSIDYNSPKMARTVSRILINTNLISTNAMNTPARKTLGLVTLYAFYMALFRKSNKKITRSINQSISKSKPNNIVLLGPANCHILLSEFLLAHLPKSTTDSRIYDHLNADLERQSNVDAGYEFERILMRVTPWLIKFSKEARVHDELGCEMQQEWPKHQVILIDKGLKFAEEIHSTIRLLVISRARMMNTMTKNDLLPIFRLSALLKSIQSIYLKQHRSFVSKCLLRIELLVRSSWSQLVGTALQRRQISTKYSERVLDLDSSLLLADICSRSQVLLTSNQGRDTYSICLSMLLAVLNQGELKNFNYSLDILRLDTFQRMRNYTNCDQLYWHMAALPTFYNHIIECSPSAMDELHDVHRALDDIVELFSVSLDERPFWSSADPNWIIERCRAYLLELSLELIEQFKSEFVDRLCQEFEVELRLQTHRELYQEEYNNPFRRHLYNFKQLIKQQAHSDQDSNSRFTIFGKTLNLRYQVEQHLNRVCYNLTAIAPHEWHTYDGMMNWAQKKHHLSFVETLLPAQTLDSGLDLLDITRNLPLFVSRYTYDLANQLFIEKCSQRNSSVTSSSSISMGSMLSSYVSALSSSQSLNVVQIKHVAQSIQTHGFGVLDTTINCVYQALKRLVNLFSRQLADDKLRATLQREHQLNQVANLHKHQCLPKKASHLGTTVQASAFSYERANCLAKQFRNTFPPPANKHNDSSSHTNPNATADLNHHQRQSSMRSVSPIDLDSIRQTVTQLGNLIAFIRLIKSGALHCVARSVDYLPELEDLSTPQLSSSVECEFSEFSMFEPLRAAASNFDQCLVDFRENFSPKTDYLQIIVNLFGGSLAAVEAEEKSGAKEDPNERIARDFADTNHETISLDESRTSSSGNSSGASNESASQSSKDQRNSLQAVVKHQRDHLKLFYLLVPPLSINYIDYLINCKERATSRSSAARFGALLSDDGFALGVAFLLRALNQIGEHQRLDWLRQTCSKFENDIGDINRRLADTKLDESLQQTSSMTLRRLTRLQLEYRAFNDTLECALLLFEAL